MPQLSSSWLRGVCPTGYCCSLFFSKEAAAPVAPPALGVVEAEAEAEAEELLPF